MLPDEIHDGCRVIQAVRMMVTIRFAYQLYLAAKLPITFGDYACVFVPRHNFVSITINMEQWHLSLSKRLEIIHGIVRISLGFSIRLETIAFQDQLPIAVTTLAFAERARPAFEIAHRRIAINAG